MKIRILFLFIAAIFFTAAPAQDTRSVYQQELDRFLQYLDKSQIPRGTLYDTVHPFTVQTILLYDVHAPPLLALLHSNFNNHHLNF